MTRTLAEMRGADIIDSRDIIERIAELEANLEELGPESDELKELETLRAFAETSDYAPDWYYGEALIRDSYFEDYAQELAEDIGDFSAAHAEWPFTYIDWPAAARALQMDYTSVTLDGIDYWIR